MSLLFQYKVVQLPKDGAYAYTAPQDAVFFRIPQKKTCDPSMLMALQKRKHNAGGNAANSSSSSEQSLTPQQWTRWMARQRATDKTPGPKCSIFAKGMDNFVLADEQESSTNSRPPVPIEDFTHAPNDNRDRGRLSPFRCSTPVGESPTIVQTTVTQTVYSFSGNRFNGLPANVYQQNVKTLVDTPGAPQPPLMMPQWRKNVPQIRTFNFAKSPPPNEPGNAAPNNSAVNKDNVLLPGGAADDVVKLTSIHQSDSDYTPSTADNKNTSVMQVKPKNESNSASTEKPTASQVSKGKSKNKSRRASTKKKLPLQNLASESSSTLDEDSDDDHDSDDDSDEDDETDSDEEAEYEARKSSKKKKRAKKEMDRKKVTKSDDERFRRIRVNRDKNRRNARAKMAKGKSEDTIRVENNFRNARPLSARRQRAADDSSHASDDSGNESGRTSAMSRAVSISSVEAIVLRAGRTADPHNVQESMTNRKIRRRGAGSLSMPSSLTSLESDPTSSSSDSDNDDVIAYRGGERLQAKTFKSPIQSSGISAEKNRCSSAKRKSEYISVPTTGLLVKTRSFARKACDERQSSPPVSSPSHALHKPKEDGNPSAQPSKQEPVKAKELAKRDAERSTTQDNSTPPELNMTAAALNGDTKGKGAGNREMEKDMIDIHSSHTPASLQDYYFDYDSFGMADDYEYPMFELTGGSQPDVVPLSEFQDEGDLPPTMLSPSDSELSSSIFSSGSSLSGSEDLAAIHRQIFST